MKHETLEDWVATIARDIQRIDHDTGWSECVGQRDAGPETFFAFITLNGRKARCAIELLGAAGLLCESPCGPDDGEGYLPYLEHVRTYPVAAIVDCLRSLAGTPLVRQEPFRADNEFDRLRAEIARLNAERPWRGVFRWLP